MAVTKYVGEEAIARVADYIKERLTVVSAMPSSPSVNQVVLYMGVTTYSYSAVTPAGTENPSEEGWYEQSGSSYVLSEDTTVDGSKTYYSKEVEYYQGGIYKYDGSNWVLQEIMKTRELTKAEYTALSPAEKKNGTIYFVKDDDSGTGGDAYDIAYDNSVSLLDATNVQDAIDEVVAEKQDVLQYSVMPTASVDNVGEIIQYVGETTADYTNGYFYKSVLNTSTSSYEWEAVVGNGSGGGAVFGYYNALDGKFYKESTYATEIVPDNKQVYVDLNTETMYRYNSTDTEYVVIGGGTYEAGFGIDITDSVISTTDFVGTQAEWDALSDAQKDEYDFVNITDDYSSASNLTPGHEISDGTNEMVQREVLEFNGFAVTDDSTNGKTIVSEIPYTAGDGVDITNKEISLTDEISRTWTGTQAEWNAIADKSEYDGWIINITDDPTSGVGVVVDAVEDANYNAVTSNAVYDELFTNLLPINITADCRETTSCNMLQVYKLGKILFIYGETVQGAGTTATLFKLPTGMVTKDAGRAPIASGVPQIYGSISWGTLDDTFVFNATADGYTKFNFVVILN